MKSPLGTQRLRASLARSVLYRRILRRPYQRMLTSDRLARHDPDVAALLQGAKSVAVPVTDAVLLCRQHGVRTANALAQQMPGVTFHLLAASAYDPTRMAALLPTIRYVQCDDQLARAEYLARVPSPQLLIDVGSNHRDLLWRFGQLLGFLAPGGTYLIEDMAAREDGERAWPEFAALAAAGDEATAGFSIEVRASCGAVGFTRRVVSVVKRLDHRINLRDARATEILTARYGGEWGTVVATREPRTFAPAAAVFQYGERGLWYGQVQDAAATTDSVKVPELTLRRYDGADCWFEQRIARDNYWLPDTFRHPYDNGLRHRRLIRLNRWHSRLPDGLPEKPGRHLDGPFFYFDTEYPGHFGHILTEVVARHWGWVCARETDPSVLPLLTRKGAGMPAFQQQLFRALDIDPAEVTYIEPGEAVRVDTVYAASSMFSMPAYVSPELRPVWDQIRERLYRPGGDRPKRLFVSRRMRRIRSCLNTEQVEAFVRGRGFHIFYPEDHDFADQVGTFADAEIIAGFAGSNMFSAMFAGAKKVVAIIPDSYTANNEFLIAAVAGGELHQVIGDAEIKHPEGRWTWPAYQSNFTVDLGLLGAALDAADAG